MLKPELQDPDQYADSLNNLVEAGKLVAQRYFDDGSIEKSLPSVTGLARGHAPWKLGRQGLLDQEFRSLFDPQKILASDWYEERLKTRLSVTRKYWSGRVDYLDEFLADMANREVRKDLESKH